MDKTTSRLSPPLYPSSFVDRIEVNDAISAAFEKDIVFMHAPAGFGKTIAMSMWLASMGLPAAWIPLTVYDDDPAVFCRYLLTALASLDKSAAKAAQSALDDTGFAKAPFEYFFKAVSMMPGQNEPSVIVLDDFHLIQNQTVLSTLPLMVAKLLQTHKLAILSRLTPPASFAGLAVKEQMSELCENDLRFTENQAKELYQGFGIGLSNEEATKIVEKTGGWALGLRAELLSIRSPGSESYLSQSSSTRYLDSYLESEVWDNWDKPVKEFMLRTSILEDLPPDLCDVLCGCDSTGVLDRLMNESGLVVRLPSGSYRYHHILLDFLRRQATKQKTDLTGCYIKSADYMFAKGMLNAAFDYYMKSGDKDAIVRFLTMIVDYGATTGSVEEYYNSINDFLIGKIPEEMIELNPYILAPCVWASLLSGDIARFKHWFAKLQVYFESDRADVDPKFLAAITLFQFPNPLNKPRDILKHSLDDIKPLAFDSVPSPSVTYNFPFFHRGHRDYSDLSDDWEELVPKYVAGFNLISNNAISLIMDGVVSGLLYEQNKLQEAKEKAINVLGQLDESSHPELWFSAQMHLAMIAFAEPDIEGAWGSIDKAQEIVEERGLYLMNNLKAVTTKYKLYTGDKEAAEEWLLRYAVHDGSDIRLYQIYQYITTIRAKITIGDFTSALVLIANLEKIVIDYQRPLDQIELYILKSIVYWNDKQRPEAIAWMGKAVAIAEQYRFVRIFANEGQAVIPILKKLYNRLSSKAEESSTAVFIRKILLLANQGTSIYPGITSSLATSQVKLSKQQKRMLLLLAAGMNNRQICEETGLKLNTVKAHLYKLYEKLDVHNSTDAVTKSHQLGLIT
ncbi:MAG: LuxR C-terminal-related transcriptional regulator [Coriobacteriia bacterium]|nr:LuxR C-terminal-related transcriptional regulator [Coriobacteriia bacterium]